MCEVGARKFSIPACSPDLNPIENMFHTVKTKLADDPFINNITHETYSAFCRRVRQTLQNYSPEIIDRTIASMDKRIGMVINGKGQHIKY